MKVELARRPPQDAYRLCRDEAIDRGGGRLRSGLDLLLYISFGRPAPPQSTERLGGQRLGSDSRAFFSQLHADAVSGGRTLRHAAEYVGSPRFATDVRRRLAAGIQGANKLGYTNKRPLASSWRWARLRP